MFIRFYFSVFFLFTVLFSFSQSHMRPAIVWQKCFGGSGTESASDVLLTSDGGMVVAGSSSSNDGDVTVNRGGFDGWVIKLSSSGNIEWQRTVGGSRDEEFKTVIKTNDGGYLCIGSTNSNDGDISGLHNEPGNIFKRDCWVVKLSANGAVSWSKSYGGSEDDVANSGILTSDGNYAIIGSTNSFDGDVHTRDSVVESDGWIYKVNSSGTLLWETSIDHSPSVSQGTNPYLYRYNTGYNVIETGNNQLLALVSGNRVFDTTIITLNEYSELDTATYTNVAHKPGILYNIDLQTGAATYFDQTIGDGAYAMVKSQHGMYFSFLNYVHQFGPGYFSGYCADEQGMVSYRDDNTGVFKNTGTSYELCESLGSTLHSIFSPAGIHGIAELIDKPWVQAGTLVRMNGCMYDAGEACLKIDNAINFLYGGQANDYFRSVKALPNGYEFVVAGGTSSVDGDLLGLHGPPELDCTGAPDDFWVLKLSLNPGHIVGNVFLDQNNNNTKDPGEPNFDKAMVEVSKPGYSVSTKISNGNYEVFTDTGNYTVKVKLQYSDFYATTPVNQTSILSGVNRSDTIDFAVHKLTDFTDNMVSLISTRSTVRPGFPVSYKIKYTNAGTDTANNKMLFFVKDNHLQLEDASAQPATISGDTLAWTINNLVPDSSGIININMLADNIPLLNNGDSVYSSVYFDSTGDFKAIDNTSGLLQLVSGSFDPNDKQEAHGGSITKLELQQGAYLTYTIRFQNTGTDTAFTVIIRDSLDERLLTGDFEMIESSHPYYLKMVNGKYITWQLDNINLADSFHDEAGSHGYITYRIKPAAALAISDTISNSAAIYFDFNPPVSTNTTLTGVTRTVAVWTGAVNDDWENKDNWNIHQKPDGETSVIIPGDAAHFPVVKTNVECYSVKVAPAASITITTGYHLLVRGK